FLIGACDDNTNKGTIQISSPADSAVITATAANPGVDIAFTVSNFTLQVPGKCAEATNCGHVHVTVDGTMCNDPAAPGPYNADGFASPIRINLSLCPMISGPHHVVAELHNDDHTSYIGPSGKPVTSGINITVP